MITLALAGCFYFAESKAQTVNGVRLTEIKSTYIEISVFRRLSTGKVWIYLDYGQQIVNRRVNTLVKDDDGKELEFNSLIDCLNKLKNYGYELFQVYDRTDEGSTIAKYYILKRK